MVKQFLRLESAAGIILMVAAALAIVADNSPVAPIYDLLLGTKMSVSVGNLGLAKPLILWINDGLMAVFFFLVGLELKRELVTGGLSTRDQALLPVLAAIGGMAVPAAVYSLINISDPQALRAWAVPAATDIAFALGILALLGSRVPVSLKIFLTALAIIDDVGAILAIAIFYTADLSVWSLGLAVVALATLAVLNILGVRNTAPYILVGAFLWVCVLKSGVHATLAGVVLALFIPMEGKNPGDPSPLKSLQHRLHPWVAFLVVPVFGFANAGVNLGDFGSGLMMSGVPLGIVAGLFIDKQVGVFGFVWLAVRLGIARLPGDLDMRMIYGVSLLTGVGFTMSLFIGGLAFDDAERLTMVKLGVLAGSLLSGIGGYLVLRWALSTRRSA